MTTSSYRSKWVQNELAHAQLKGKIIFPLLLEGENTWLSVEALQYVDVRNHQLPPQTFFNQLIEYISHSKIQLVNDLTWTKFKEACANLSNIDLGRFGIEDRTKGFILPRMDIQNQISEFLNSKKSIFVVAGESGMGKSCIMKDTATRLQKDPNRAVIVYDASSLSDEISLANQLEEDLSRFLKTPKPDIIRKIDQYLICEGRQLIVIIDAINNKCSLSDPYNLVIQIEKILKENCPWIKVILTSRLHYWKQVLRNIPLSHDFYFHPAVSEGNYLLIGSYSPCEASQIYEYYKNTAFHFRGPNFEDLHELTKKKLLDPLLFRLVAEISETEDLLKDISSLDIDIVPRYVNHLREKDKLNEEEIEFLTKGINFRILTEGNCDPAIKREDIINLQFLGNNQKHRITMLDKLLKSGILIETTSGVGTDPKPEIRYRFDRFRDYFLGEQIKEEFKI